MIEALGNDFDATNVSSDDLANSVQAPGVANFVQENLCQENLEGCRPIFLQPALIELQRLVWDVLHGLPLYGMCTMVW